MEFPLIGKRETQFPFLKREEERPREQRPVNSISVQQDNGADPPENYANEYREQRAVY